VLGCCLGWSPLDFFELYRTQNCKPNHSQQYTPTYTTCTPHFPHNQLLTIEKISLTTTQYRPAQLTLNAKMNSDSAPKNHPTLPPAAAPAAATSATAVTQPPPISSARRPARSTAQSAAATPAHFVSAMTAGRRVARAGGTPRRDSRMTGQ